MPGSADEVPLSIEELRAAVASRDLPGLVARLVRERSWGALIALFAHAGGAGASSLGLSELEMAARALAVALDAVPPPKHPRAALLDELRTVRLTAAEALLARGAPPPLAEVEVRARRRAAALLGAAGDHARAAAVHEELGDDASAAAAWGALGDLDRMEAAHARVDARDGHRRAALEAMRGFDALLAAGERRRAIAAAAAMASDLPEAGTARERAARIEARLVRARGVTLRVRGGAAVRFAALPATLGRDPLAEVTLRDPGASRRHAAIRTAGAGELVLEDLGSRAGVVVAGARIDGPFPLRGEGQLTLGATTPLVYSVLGGACVVLRGVSGLDRELLALVGADPLDVSLVLPEARGLTLALSGGGARLSRRADVPVRVEGSFIGAACDLLHGDVVELPGPAPLVLEVA
jgi:hypothetical protein